MAAETSVSASHPSIVQFDTTKSSKRRFSSASCFANSQCPLPGEFENTDSRFHARLVRTLVAVDLPPYSGLLIAQVARLTHDQRCEIDTAVRPIFIFGYELCLNPLGGSAYRARLGGTPAGRWRRTSRRQDGRRTSRARGPPPAHVHQPGHAGLNLERHFVRVRLASRPGTCWAGCGQQLS